MRACRIWFLLVVSEISLATVAGGPFTHENRPQTRSINDGLQSAAIFARPSSTKTKQVSNSLHFSPRQTGSDDPLSNRDIQVLPSMSADASGGSSGIMPPAPERVCTMAYRRLRHGSSSRPGRQNGMAGFVSGSRIESIP